MLRRDTYHDYMTHEDMVSLPHRILLDMKLSNLWLALLLCSGGGVVASRVMIQYEDVEPAMVNDIIH